MAIELIDFWRRCPLDHFPFAHPEDLPILMRNRRWFDETDPTSFAAYLESKRFGDPKDDRLHLSLIPVPYLGNLEKAKIVILLLNPGFEYSDYWADTVNKQYRERLKKNLVQDFQGIEFPFLCLDPAFAWHSGFTWWEKKLREVIWKIAVERFKGRYLDALQDLSTRLGCIELVPYHSASFKDHKLIEIPLPSIRIARDYVRQDLVPNLAANNQTLIATRQVKKWGLAPDMTNVVVYEGGHTRGASMSIRSKGGKAILEHYRIV